MLRIIYKKLLLQSVFVWTSLCAYGQAFEQVLDKLPDVGSSAFVWADFNNDGFLDLALSGINNSNTNTNGIYINQGDDTFLSLGAGLISVSDGAMATGDINNDGWIDLLVTGVSPDDTYVTVLYKNKGDGTFSVVDASLEGVAFSDVAMADYNNDGRTDLFIIGVNNEGERVTKIYTNKENGFEELPLGFEGVSQGSLLVMDFNNDGFLDFLFHGADNTNQPVIYFYLNDGVGGFSLVATDLLGLNNGRAAAADINQDGYVDLFLSGTRFGTSYTQIFLSNGGEGFTPYLDFAGVVESTVGFGDYDNDGDIDLFYSGLEGTVFKAYLYENNLNALVRSGIEFPGIGAGKAGFADYNNDGKLDLFLTGYSTTAPASNLYKNNHLTSNTPPSAPTGLKVHVYHDSAVFSWNPSHDLETVQEALTYDLYVGTSPDKDDVLPAMADIDSGWRKTVSLGTYTDTFAMVKNLPEGKYYWGVQAVDQGYSGSAFSPAETFYVCYDIHIEEERIGCGDVVVLKYTDADESDIIAWFNDKTPDVPFSTSAQVELLVVETTNVWLEVERHWGCQVKTSRVIEANPATLINMEGNRKICSGDSIQLGGYPTAGGSLLPYTYQWSPALNMDNPTVANPTVWPTETTTYELVVYSGGCEVGGATVTVAVNPLPNIDAGQDQAIGLNETVQLWVSGGEHYSWSPSESLNDATSHNPIAQPITTTTYYVIGTDANGCHNSDSVTIKVRSEIFVPNLFSPNQDGENDIFYMYGTGIKEIYWAIYDLNGQKIFESNAIEKGWDGMVNGSPAPLGVYIWMLKGIYYDGRPLAYNGKNQGNFRLVR